MLDNTRLTIETYDRCAGAYEARFMDITPYKQTFDAFLRHVHDSGSLLDLGCGPGNVSRYLLSQRPSLALVGVDLSEEMIRIARRNVPQARFEVKDIREIDFPNASFDHVVASFCLPFLYNEEAEALIGTLARITSKGGCIYLSTMMGSGSGYETTSFSGSHQMFFNYYTKDFLDGLFGRNALTVLEYTTQEYVVAGSPTLTDMIYILRRDGD